MNELTFELGKRYRVTFNDGRVLEVLFTGGDVPRFEVTIPTKDTLEGTAWLNGYKSIDEVEDEIEKEGGLK